MLAEAAVVRELNSKSMVVCGLQSALLRVLPCLLMSARLMPQCAVAMIVKRRT